MKCTKKFGALAIMLIANMAAAKDAVPLPMTAEELRSRFEVRGEIYVLDDTGTKVLQAPSQNNVWRSRSKDKPLESNWGSTSNIHGSLHMHHVWSILPDGSIKVLVEEYADGGRDSKPRDKDLLKKQDFILKDFSPILWKMQNNKAQNVMVRLTPVLRPEEPLLKPENMPLAGRGVIVTDSAGYLWAQNAEFRGKYIGLTTHRGTIVMSFYPFKGSAEVGDITENKIVLKPSDGFSVTLTGEEAFIPSGVRARVYALYLPEKRTDSVHSIHSFDSSTEESILQTISENK